MTEPGNPYAAIAAGRAGRAFSQIRFVAETASTNADASALLGTPGDRGTTIVTDYQTRGEGRKGRTWQAAAGNSLLFTTTIPQPIAASDLWIVPFWTAIAVRRALGGLGIDTIVKWPNDLLLGARKLAGILCISRVSGDRAWAACGIGINVRRDASADTIAPPPAFCDDVRPVERAALLRDILEAFDALLPSLGETAHIARVWESEAGVPGARYRLLKDGEREPFDATALALCEGGGLLVERADGRRETIALADARALRDAT